MHQSLLFAFHDPFRARWKGYNMKSRGLRQGVHTVHERRFDVRSAELVAVGQVGF